MDRIKFKSDFKGEYRIGQTIDQDQLGEFRRCRHIQSDQVFTVRIINKDGLQMDDYERFLREISILQELDHPNIIKCRE